MSNYRYYTQLTHCLLPPTTSHAQVVPVNGLKNLVLSQGNLDIELGKAAEASAGPTAQQGPAAARLRRNMTVLVRDGELLG